MNHPIANAFAEIEQWQQSAIKAGAAVRLLIEAAKRADITQAQLSRILELSTREIDRLSKCGFGPVKRVKSSELINP